MPDLKFEFSQDELASLKEAFDEYSLRSSEPDGKVNFKALFENMEDRLLGEEGLVESNRKLVYEILRRILLFPEFQTMREVRVNFDEFVTVLKKSM